MTAELVLNHPTLSPRPQGFENWRARLDRERIDPVIAVAGSRGKTSVLRAVESILRSGGYRFASWTDRGVEIDGQNQSGELCPWARVLTSLGAGGLDVALQEVDWATVQTLGANGKSLPIFAVANLCANSEACLVTPETMQARRALERIRTGVAPIGRLVLNADDFAVADEDSSELGQRYLFGISPETPVLRRHLQRGGDACWIAGSSIVIHEDGSTRPLVDLRWLRWTRGGSIPFAVQTALTATAIGRSCGLPDTLIAAGLVAHEARSETMPGSFNVFAYGSSTIVVDRPVSSWFLRATLRAAASLGAGRHIRLAGPMIDVPTDDLLEVGRLLGRGGGVLVVHGEWSEQRMGCIRQGAAINDVPPIFLQAADERSAIQQAVGMLRSDDVMLVLAEDPAAVVRLIARRTRRLSIPPREAAGVA
jgi:cyanophycin synthetase